MNNRTMPSCTIIPVLFYDDVDEAVTWLCNTFGFIERWRAGNHRAQLSFGDGAIAVSSKQGSLSSDSSQLKTCSIMVRVDNVTTHYENAKQHGAQIINAPEDFFYGERQYSVFDVGGYTWTFSQSIADLTPEDWGGISVKH